MLKPYCPECNNTGWLNCYCGGNLCVCANNGEYPCFACEGDEDADGEWDYSGDTAL